MRLMYERELLMPFWLNVTDLKQQNYFRQH